ncbi:MAG TPA: Fe-S cluster assembly protein SufD, partial [Pseudohongiella sp.]|nr:Fe-S cluster assembly protein SufD [Pseudohongiella sp.]
MTQPVQPSDFQKRALTLAQQRSAPAFLQTVRQQGLDEFGQIQWPGRKTEMWKYTTLRPVEAFANAEWPADDVAADGEQLASLPELDATRLVFVDGLFDGAASDELPDGVRLFSQADEAARVVLDQYLG